MKKTKIIGLAILALTGFSLLSCTINRPQTEQVRTITVNGTGSVNVQPNLLSLTLSVKTRDWNVNNAVTANANITEKVIQAITEASVSKSDIQTFDYKISQETDISNGREYPGRYNVTNSIKVLIRNPSLAGNIIDTAVKNGSNSLLLSDFEYSVSDTTTYVREARTLAVRNATDAANLLAGASGCKVDKVMNIYESFTTARASSKIMEDSNAASTPLEEGTIAVTSTVTITYSIID